MPRTRSTKLASKKNSNINSTPTKQISKTFKNNKNNEKPLTPITNTLNDSERKTPESFNNGVVKRKRIETESDKDNCKYNNKYILYIFLK